MMSTFSSLVAPAVPPLTTKLASWQLSVCNVLVSSHLIGPTALASLLFPRNSEANIITIRVLDHQQTISYLLVNRSTLGDFLARSNHHHSLYIQLLTSYDASILHDVTIPVATVHFITMTPWYNRLYCVHSLSSSAVHINIQYSKNL